MDEESLEGIAQGAGGGQYGGTSARDGLRASTSTPTSSATLAIDWPLAEVPNLTGGAVSTRIGAGDNGPIRPHHPDFEPYVPEQVARDDPRRRGVPVNVPVYAEPMHFMASVQAFTRGGFEVTAKLVNAQKIAETRCLAARARPRLRRADGERDPQSIVRSRQRAKTRVRHVCKEIGADRIVTLTTRERANTVESMLDRWQRWIRLVSRANGRPFHYVAVLEPHPSNPAHLHLHVAVAVFLNVNTLRQCWWQVCGGRAQGNVHIKRLGSGELERRVSRVASYISKYLTKETLVRFNKKSYWSSRVSLPEVRRYWLRARTMSEALAELVQDFGVRFGSSWVSPDQGVFWAQMRPGDEGDPPF